MRRSIESVRGARCSGPGGVTISSWGFHGSDDEVVRQAIDSMGGFSLVLAGLTGLLEHDVELNLVADPQSGARS